MKNLKKIILGVSALAVASTLSITAIAENGVDGKFKNQDIQIL